MKLSFSHTALTSDYIDNPTYSPYTSFFTLYDDESHISVFARIKNELLISYNLKMMHQILTLNFFRFIDQLEDKDGKADKSATKQKIYSALNKLHDNELEETLQDIARKWLTQWSSIFMEFIKLIFLHYCQ